MEIYANNQGIITKVDGDSKSLCGWESHEMIGNGVEMLIPEDYRANHVGGMNRYIQTGNKKAMGSWLTVPMLHKSGLQRTVSFCVTEKDGVLVAVIREVEGEEIKLASIKHRDTIESIMNAAVAAKDDMRHWTQEQADSVCEAIAEAVETQATALAEMAHLETNMGNAEDKAAKNILASREVWNDIRDVKTCDLIEESEDELLLASPMGVILAIIPVTNPTSTTIYKILSCLKSRNSIVIIPASRAAQSTVAAAKVCLDAAIAQGAPEGCITWLAKPERALTQTLILDKRVSLILATGGEGLVATAYSSGTPALGVGAGNVPVFVADDADIELAAEKITLSKNFDNGVICASEQAIVCSSEVADRMRQALMDNGAAFVDPEKLRSVCIDPNRGTMHPAIVGKPAKHIADKADIEVPDDVRLLVAELNTVGPEEHLSKEILAPVIAFYEEPTEEAALERCSELNMFGGVGHTVVIYTKSQDKIIEFSERMVAGRILVNQPSSLGAVGLGNTFHPSFTLGCGTGGKNITTRNVTARDLVNLERVSLVG
jgi:acetaldehyde dehydrogenase / alcohol dehydrogenase